jgi:hypothetical protein
MYHKKNGGICTRYAKFDLECFPVCGTHHNKMKRQEDCAVCLDTLSSNSHVKLSCGHMFHINCLLGCTKRECPLCRAKISPEDCCKIFYKTITKPLVKDIFSQTDEHQSRLFNGISLLLATHNKSEWLCRNICFFIQQLYNTHLDENKLFIVLRIFDALLTHMETYNTLTNFDIQKWGLNGSSSG